MTKKKKSDDLPRIAFVCQAGFLEGPQSALIGKGARRPITALSGLCTHAAL